MNFAEQLKHIMETENITAKEISDKCNISETTICRYLSGDRSPTLNNAKFIFETFGYDISVVKKTKTRKSKKENIYKNASGCYDPVAGAAITKADAERERLTKLLDTIFTICDYAGFHVEGRIELLDRRTGKVWKQSD